MKILAVKCPQVAVVFGKCGREVLLPPGNTGLVTRKPAEPVGYKRRSTRPSLGEYMELDGAMNK